MHHLVLTPALLTGDGIRWGSYARRRSAAHRGFDQRAHYFYNTLRRRLGGTSAHCRRSRPVPEGPPQGLAGALAGAFSFITFSNAAASFIMPGISFSISGKLW